MQSAPQSSHFLPHDLSSSFAGLPGTRPPQSVHPLENSEDNMDIEHSSYDLFSSNPPSFNAAGRYRSYSSASSIETASHLPSYTQDLLYSHSSGSFNETLNTSGSFDSSQSLPSTYASTGSPISPSDSNTLHRSSYSLPGLSGFPPTTMDKDLNGNHAFNDLLVDRRQPNIENYDDFGINPFTGPQSSRLPGLPPESQFPHHSPGISLPMRQKSSFEMFRHVAPQATHSFKMEPGSSGFSEGYTYGMGGADLGLRLPVTAMGVDEALSRAKHQAQPGNDLQSFIRPYLDQYMNSSNRIGHGERAVIVMSSKVAQKSYGTEKRFLCPPPTAIMIGNSWWSDSYRRGEEAKLSPPRAVISISGEPPPQESPVEWTGTSGKTFDISDPPTGTTYIGRCVGKQLFISDVDEKRKKVEALVKIMAPASEEEPDRIIGTFSSRPIKVISKPSKKRQSAKNLELCINHGSTISLFHRLRSQTVSTKYLCVSGSGSSLKGSDGASLPGIDARHRHTTPSFVARTASWDPFIIYIVDVEKSGSVDAPPPPPPQPDYPSPPPNAITFTNNGSQIPVYYNQTVVLQCLTSGVVSPVLIIRKVDHGTVVVGGGLQEGAKGVPDSYCPPGEVCGDPVSQLHKVAFEVYDAAKAVTPPPGSPGATSSFLSCMGEKVNTYRPAEGRSWTTPPTSSPGSHPPSLPDSPLISTPNSAAAVNGATEYFARLGNVPPSPPSSGQEYPPSSDGGRVKRPKRNSVSNTANPVTKAPKGRRRQNSASSVSSRAGSNTIDTTSSGAVWQVDIGETSVWTIVGTDQVRYNFYVPPVLFDSPQSSNLASLSYPIPAKPVTPIPAVVKYLMPDRAAEAPKATCTSSRTTLVKPHPQASKMLTIYGENFSKADPVTVFFGAEPSPHVEIRCTEVLTCLPPETPSQKRTQIVLVRGDGVVFPSNVLYP